jgi:hypothetical protein
MYPLRLEITFDNGNKGIIKVSRCFKDIIDRSVTITKDIIDHAKEVLIVRRDTHLDVLMDRLKEPRVRVIIDAILAGTGGESDFQLDDLQYVRDLGLVIIREFY